MTVRLPESFSLPDGRVYDRLVKELDQDIAEEGSAGLYLGMVRTKRRHSELLNSVLQQEAGIGLLMENRDRQGRLEDIDHKLANTALSGMLFGHFLNEKYYPHLMNGIMPYRPLVKISFLGDHMGRYMSLGGESTATGRRYGFSVMAETQLDTLNDESAHSVTKWSEEVIIDRGMRPSFVFGMGYSIFQTWAAYEELMVQQGLTGNILNQDRLTENNRGEGTSI